MLFSLDDASPIMPSVLTLLAKFDELLVMATKLMYTVVLTCTVRPDSVPTATVS